jgi:hypothetical protein
METLSKLFGSQTKVKIIKLFVFNSGVALDGKQVAERTKENISKVRREAGNLQKMGLIKKKVFYKTEERRVRGRKVSKKVKTSGWILNDNFEHIIPLRTFLVSLNHLAPKELARKLSRVGTVKLIIVAGVFIHDVESRVDLLIVGDNMKRGMLDTVIKTIESEIGVELRYAYFETADFKYRLGLYDKLIRDILDFPHETVINKIGAL